VTGAVLFSLEILIMTVEYKNIRPVVLEYLKKRPKGQFNLIGNQSLKLLFEKYEFPLDEKNMEILQQVIHELYIEKIIYLGDSPNASGAGAWSWPFYRLTQYGEKVVNNTEYQPYDPSGYLLRLKSEMPSIDEVILRYLEESLNCFRANFLFAAAVMIGCAAEKCMILLIEIFAQSILDSTKREKYEKEIDARMISRKYEAIWKRLEPIASSLPNELGNDLHVILDRIFDLIRTSRNEAGHPTGKKVEQEVVHANLILFPSYCRRVYGLIDYFSKSKI
jgi:hypothetical protein